MNELASQWCGWAVDLHEIDYGRVPRLLRPIVYLTFQLAVLVTVCFLILLLIWEAAKDEVGKRYVPKSWKRYRVDRTCSSCKRTLVDKGSHFACTVCDFDPDPRP